VEVDLSEDWVRLLLRAGFDTRARVVWVAEGLLSYLSADVRDALIETTGHLSIARSRLGLTLAARSRVVGTHQGEPDSASKPRNYRALFRSTALADPRGWLAARGWQADLVDMVERSDSHERPSSGGGDEAERACLVDATRL
jgi:methyltransferase (TIGR00027 family)